jgi:glycosyltransferase involved in cell wall biosynthesis
MIRIFTPSFADEADTNAQNLTVKEIVARLDPKKFHVTMLCETAADARIAARPNTRILPWHRRGNTLRVLAHLLRNVPDIYFFPREGPLDAGFLQLRRLIRLPTALVTYVVSGGQLESGSPRPTLARNIREAEAVYGNSHYLVSLLRDRLGVHAVTMHNGIDRRFFFPADISRTAGTERCKVLFAGSFRTYKRADIVIRQAARWPRVEFRLAGKGEEEGACRALATQFGCRNVVFVGHLPLSQLGEEMRQADVFLFPSVVEGHPQVLGQAAASGLPVVAMSVYHPDYVVHQETGFLANTDRELETWLDLLLTKPELREAMSRCAIEYARKFDWDEITCRWQGAFERAVAGKRGA